MRLFGGEKMQRMMEFLKVPDDMPIENKMISGSIESAQKKVEGHNFDIRKSLVEYDDVMNAHREIVYGRRRKILMHEDIAAEIQALIFNEAEKTVDAFIENRKSEDWELEGLLKALTKIYEDTTQPLTKEKLETFTAAELKEFAVM